MQGNFITGKVSKSGIFLQPTTISLEYTIFLFIQINFLSYKIKIEERLYVGLQNIFKENPSSLTQLHGRLV